MAAKFDHIIIGAGIQGSSTAYQLAKRGKNTLLIEQFTLGHGKGSSHGLSRVIRNSRKECFAKLINDAYKEWEEVEKESGKTYYTKTGFLYVGKLPCVQLEELKEDLSKLNLNHQVLSSEEIKLRFPSLNYPENYEGVYDDDAGVLTANIALESIQVLFRRYGGVVKENCKVVKITPGKEITLTTNEEILKADSVVICCGPWTSKVLKDLHLNLPLQLVKIGVSYWKCEKQENFGKDKFPCFVDLNSCESFIFAGTAVEYPNLIKFCYRNGLTCDPDQTDNFNFDKETNEISEYIKNYISDLQVTPSIQESCHITVTPDEAFILDKHPKFPNIVIGAGFSGEGFQFGPLVGKILADFAEDKVPNFDVKAFKIDRFNS